jgi:glycosyltransferase involved in cell wall biosynthesis
MKIAVLNNSVPFLKGGAEILAESLVRELEARDHEVELVKVPLRWRTEDDVAESMFAASSLRVPEADLVIALKFPAYLVPHPNKVIWLLHQFRQVYDLWGTELQDLQPGPASDELRKAIQRADDWAFTGSLRIFCNSEVTAGRLRRFSGKCSEILLAPLPNPDAFQPSRPGDTVLALGRVTGGKRQHLVLEALAHTKSNSKLVIAGAPETQGDLARLEQIVTDRGLAGRVELIPRFISEAEKVDLLRDARAVAYLPKDEDSYGYVTAEAMLSGKPVITCSDSGGILELVRDGSTGVVAEPTAESLAAALDRLSDRSLAESLGHNAVERVRALRLSWDTAIERLLA